MSRNNPNFAPVQGSSDAMLMQGAVQNGRVDLMSALPSLNIPQYQTRQTNNQNYSVEATYGQMAPSDLSNTFFCPANIDALQEGIRYRVYVETNGKYVIGRQNDQELKIVMRSIFYQNAKFQSNDVIGQVRALNAKVLDWAVPEILSNLKQYETYRRDASTLPLVMDHPQMMTSKGSKQLELPTFT